MMRRIPISKGQFAIVDDDDYDFLISYGDWWVCSPKGYAINYIYKKKVGNRSIYDTISMHRLIMNPSKDMEIDHINGNPLDNRRCNLRVCTAAQNAKNRLKHKIGTSIYKGVNFFVRDKKWKARIHANGKSIHLGLFDSEDEAATAYNMAALRHYGEFARLNLIPTRRSA